MSKRILMVVMCRKDGGSRWGTGVLIDDTTWIPGTNRGVIMHSCSHSAGDIS